MLGRLSTVASGVREGWLETGTGRGWEDNTRVPALESDLRMIIRMTEDSEAPTLQDSL